MKDIYVRQWVLIPSLTLFLSLLLTIGLFTALTFAQEPEPDLPAMKKEQSLGTQSGEKVAYWLILDSAKPVEETLPPLLARLTQLRAAGLIVDFDPTPQASAPTAVPGVQLIAKPNSLKQLRYLDLPGVLAVSDTLPPPPPEAGDIGVLATTGSITGRVTALGTGTPLNVIVFVYDAVSFASIDSNSTDANGFYTMTVTAPYSQVKVLFNDYSIYASEWYNDKPYFSEANPINIPQGSVVTINAALAKLGSISGVVTHDGGGPADNLAVWAPEANHLAYTDGSGQFNLKVPAGSYRLSFSSDGSLPPFYLQEWYQDKDSYETANLITVTNAMTTFITAQVTRADVITGVVTDVSTGLPIEFEVEVAAFDASNNIVGRGFTTIGGQYALGVKPGNYKIRFQHNLLSYNTEYYNNRSTLAQADWVSVSPGIATTNINAALTPAAGLITGTITKNGGWPLDFGEAVDVDLYDAATGDYLLDLPYLQFTGDGATTTYAFAISPGLYKVHFFTYSDDLIDEWYTGKNDITQADVVTITDVAPTSNISVDFGGANCITGTVTSSGVSLAGARVQAYRTGSDFLASSSLTNSAGAYQLCLDPGDYQVSFSYFPSTTTWYNDKLSRTAANTVTVTTGVTTTNINGTLNSLGGCISGKIVDSYNLGLPFANFLVRDVGNQTIPFWNGTRFGTTLTTEGFADSDGGFVACGLATGSYTLECFDANDRQGVTPANVVAPNETGNLVCSTSIGSRIYLPIIKKN